MCVNRALGQRADKVGRRDRVDLCLEPGFLQCPDGEMQRDLLYSTLPFGHADRFARIRLGAAEQAEDHRQNNKYPHLLRSRLPNRPG